MLSCAALSSQIAIVQLSSEPHKLLQVNNWVEKKRKIEKSRPPDNEQRRQLNNLCQRWACRQQACVLCVILSSPPDPKAVVPSSSIAYSAPCTRTASVWLSGNITTIACAIFQCSALHFYTVTTPSETYSRTRERASHPSPVCVYTRRSALVSNRSSPQTEGSQRNIQQSLPKFCIV